MKQQLNKEEESSKHGVSGARLTNYRSVRCAYRVKRVYSLPVTTGKSELRVMTVGQGTYR